MKICRIEMCKEFSGYKKCMCNYHWSLVPWELRRLIAKTIRKNDMRLDTSEVNHLQNWSLRIVNQIAGKQRKSDKNMMGIDGIC